MGVQLGGTLQRQDCQVISGNYKPPLRRDGGMSMHPEGRVRDFSVQATFPVDPASSF